MRLRDDGTPVLDYPLTPFVWDGVRRAFLAMAEIQFAAGATRVSPAHGYGAPFTSFAHGAGRDRRVRPASARTRASCRRT